MSGNIATGAGTKVGVTLKLSQLQNLCKRDPRGYKEDYDAQVRRLESELGILALQGGANDVAGVPGGGSSKSESSRGKRLEELVQFAAAVSSSSYKGVESDRIARLFTGVLVGNPIEPSTAADQTHPSSSPSHQSVSSTRTVSHVVTMPTAALRLPKDIRKSLVSALILMRNKGAVEPLRLLELFFRIMSVVPDKSLREMLHRHIVNDVRNINKKGKRDDKVNRSVQSFFHRIVSSHGGGSSSADNVNVMNDEESATDVAAKRATDMVCELYRRRVWTDSRTVAIAATACLSPNATVMSRALRFFLNIEEKMAYDLKQQQDEEYDASSRIDYHSHSRKTGNRQRHVARQLKKRKKAILEKQGGGEADWMDAVNPDNDHGVEASKKLYPAIELLRDPQGLAEAILKRLKSSSSGNKYKYETKLLMMNFVTRLVGNHELMLMPLYSYLTKYLSGQQRDVTAILAYTVQACHEHVPPDEVHGLLKTIAHNFITERCSEEQMAVGINAARAICSRVPSVMSGDDDEEYIGDGESGAAGSQKPVAMDIEAFARDLAAFANHRDRSISIAGKGWQNFVRETNPGLLQGKHRGLKGTAMKRAGVKPLKYGESRTATGVEGADLLVEYESKKKAAAAARRRHSKEEEGDADEAAEDEGSDDDDGDSAPDLVLLDGDQKKEAAACADDTKESGKDAEGDGEEEVLDVSKMTREERDRLKQEVSSTRIFTASDFAKMRKLVERERRMKSDPREAARRKRALAKSGRDFENLSGDEDDDNGDGDNSNSDEDDGDGLDNYDESSEDEDEQHQVRIAGAVNPGDIMAHAKKKRQSKAEKLQRVIAGRDDFEAKHRAGGSTNIEKKRKKNFLMSKSSREARAKNKGKTFTLQDRKRKKQRGGQFAHEAKKRRRK